MEKNINFIIESDIDLPYLDEVVDYLNNKAVEIMSFFDLKQLDDVVKIVVWNDMEKYKEHCNKYTKYKEWMCGDTFDGNINLLSVAECKNTKCHSEMDLDELKKTIAHEFVHICHSKAIVEPIEEKFRWFWEALASNLATPFDSLSRVKVSKDELMYNFNEIKDGYKIAFSIGKYMLLNYSKEHILNYIKYPKTLFDDTDKILLEANTWICDIIEKHSNISKKRS